MKEKTVAYQNGITALFFLTWGFMFIDRLAISFIFPVIVPELELTNGQVGTVNMSFTIMWGVSAIVVCAIADKVGNLKMWLLVSGFPDGHIRRVLRPGQLL